MITAVDYHTRTEHSRSMIADFIESRRLFEAKYITKTFPTDISGDFLNVGTLTHETLLEPHIETKIVVPPKEVLTSDGKRTGNKYKSWCDANPSLIPLTQKDYDVAMRAVESLRKAIGMMVNHEKAEREKEIYWTDEETGFKMRAKLDVIVPTRIGTHVIDVKTCSDLSKFQYEIRDRRLWLQVAHYLTGLKVSEGIDAEFIFCVVEKSGIYRVRNFQLAEETRHRAFIAYRETLTELAKCYETGDWSDVGEGDIETIDIKI